MEISDNAKLCENENEEEKDESIDISKEQNLLEQRNNAIEFYDIYP